MEDQERTERIAALKKWIEENEKDPNVEPKYVEAARNICAFLKEEQKGKCEEGLDPSEEFDPLWSSGEKEEPDPDQFWLQDSLP